MSKAKIHSLQLAIHVEVQQYMLVTPSIAVQVLPEAYSHTDI